jgi:uncharacterized membrane protein
MTATTSPWDGTETSWGASGGVPTDSATIGTRLDDAVSKLEDLTALDAANTVLGPIAERLDSGTLGAVLGGQWLGHAVHPLLTDLPIGFWTSSWVLDMIGGKSSRTASTRLIGLGLLAAVPTAASGAVEWNRIPTTGAGRVGVAHAIANSAAMACYFGSWRARHNGHHWRGVMLGHAGALAATAGGHLGGHLAYALGIGRGRRNRQTTAT